MCGRFTLIDPSQLALRFGVGIPEQLQLRPRYNIAPTQDVLAVTGNDGRRLGLFRWGLIPHWAKDAGVGFRMINARAETLVEKPSFRSNLKTKRCLIPADGFFEWQAQGSGKQPLYIRLKDGRPFAFAGLYDTWQGSGGEVVSSCTIITTVPNELMATIHNRMPVILSEQAETVWLDCDIVEPERLVPLLRPYPAETMVAYPVSTVVNSPRNNSPACIERIS